MADARDQESSDGSATNRSLILGLRDRREEAWNDMVHIYYPLVYAWCRRQALKPDDIPDVVQEVFQAVANGLAGFRHERPGDTFRGWLRGITRHKLLDFHRTRAKQAAGVGGSGNIDAMAAVPDALDDAADERSQAVAAAVHRALDLIRPEFEPTTWQAFERVQMRDEPPAEVAESLGMTANAVYKAKARVLHRLKVQLGDVDGVIADG